MSTDLILLIGRALMAVLFFSGGIPKLIGGEGGAAAIRRRQRCLSGSSVCAGGIALLMGI